jgi:putative ABC transport system permease protein
MRRVLRRLRHLVERERFEEDLRDELALHQRLKEEELVERGVDSQQAARESRRALGSVALASDRARDVWSWPWLQDLGRDLRLAARLVRSNPWFSSAIVVVLGLGIGVASLQFVLIDAICIRGLPIDGVGRVLFFGARDTNQRETALSHQEFEHLRAAVTNVDGMAAFSSAPGVVGDADRAPDRVQITFGSAPLFDTLRERPLLGRTFEDADDRPGAPPVVILSAPFWRARYASDPAIVGRQIRVNGTPTTVVAVMRDPLRFPNVTDVWLPLAVMPGVRSERRAARLLSVIGRLGNGDGLLAAVRTSLSAASVELARASPGSNAGVSLTAVPINERYNGRLTDPVWLAFGGVALIVLLIACANAANLLLMRAAHRGHEIAVRASIGASRTRLVRQLLAESLTLALLGGAFGAGMSALGLLAINSIIPANTLAYWMRFALDARALILVMGITASTVVIFGLMPALHLARADVSALLRSGGRVGFGRRRGRGWMTTFLTVQCGLTMVMLAALTMGVQSSKEAGRRFVSIDPANVLTTWVTLPADRYPSAATRRAFYTMLEQRVATLPGVTSSAVASTLPLSGAAPRRLELDGEQSATPDPLPTVWTVAVSARYFEALAVPLLRGRAFEERDGTNGAESVIVNQRFVELFSQSVEPIGRRVRLTDSNSTAPPTPFSHIVGVVPVVRQRTNTADADPIVYVPIAGAPPTSSVLLVRGDARVEALAGPLRELVRGIDQELPLYRTLALDDALDVTRWSATVSEVLLNCIAGIAVCLAAIGLYAILTYAAVLRRRDTAIRAALGARTSQMIALVAKDAAIYLTLGVTAGIVCAHGFAKLTGSDVGEVRMTDPITLAAATGLLSLVVIVASIAPSRLATRIDPAQVLRES